VTWNYTWQHRGWVSDDWNYSLQSPSHSWLGFHLRSRGSGDLPYSDASDISRRFGIPLQTPEQEKLGRRWLPNWIWTVRLSICWNYDRRITMIVK
jgi:hypothetical protein